MRRCSEKFTEALFIVFLLAAAFLAMSSTPSHAQEEVVLYEEDFNDNKAQGWELEPGWTVDAGMLNGYGHAWARYTKGHWGDARFAFKLRSNGVHVNVRFSDTGRYAVGFRAQNDHLSIYLFKQLWHETYDLATKATEYNAKEEHEVEISAIGGRIQVTVDGNQVIDYTDPDPLPPGTIAFETLNDTFAQVDDIVITGEVAEPPILAISPEPFIFKLEMNAGEKSFRKISISNAGGGTLIWNVSADSPWISASPQNGTNSGIVTININTAGLSPGDYSGTITVTSNDGTKTGRIILTIPTPTPIITLTPSPIVTPASEEGTDLTISSIDYWFEDDGRILVLSVEIANQGNAVAPDTLVYVEDIEHNWLYEYGSVQALDPEETTWIEIRLDIPEELHGTRCMFSVEVDPEDAVREIDEENNEATTPWIQLPEPSENEPPLLEVIVILGIICVITFIIRRTIRIQYHKEWQKKAKEEGPPDTCHPCTRYCRKIVLELKPALRKITHLSFVVSEPVSGEQSRGIQVKGELVDGLNKAVMAHRRREMPEKLREQVAPLAHALLLQITDRLRGKRGESAPRDISITGHLEGGKVSCQFILYHCKRRGKVNVWEEEAKWKATIKDECDVFVGTLRNLEPTEQGILKQVPDMTRLLMLFIKSV